MESCVSCESTMPLDYIIKDYDSSECKDCRAERLNGGYYEPVFPLTLPITPSNVNRLQRLLKWALG